MKPEEAAAWIPVVRDATLLIGGAACVIFGLLKANAGLVSLGFGVSAIGAVGRATPSGV